MNQQNFTTLLIPGPNGSQPQMIKVVGSSKIPIQLTTSTGTNIPTIKKGTFIQDGKIQGRQIITVPVKPSTITVPGIRGPLVVPVSNIQLKPQTAIREGIIVSNSNVHPTISSPLVICNQSGITTNTVQSINFPTHQASKNITGMPLIQTQVKHITTTPKIQKFPIHNIPDIVHTDIKPIGVTKVQNVRPVIDNQISGNGVCGSPPKSLMNTSILDHSGIRKRHDFELDYSIENKRRKTEKGGKGLRHFSMKVCEKVKAKGTTSYNEVADELVHEFTDSGRTNPLAETATYDQKNIRRRVYDALNVLMAMNIISKEKKEIKWLGLPTNSAQECSKLEQERKKVMQRIKLKTQQLQDLILQQIAFKNLVERNRKREKETGEPQWTAALQLPFIIVNTDQDTTIDCAISNAKEEYMFNFDNTFEIHDDIEVLKRMGMSLGLEKGKCTPENLEFAKKMIPKALEDYVVELAKNCPDDDSKNEASCGLELVEDNSTDIRIPIKEERLIQMALSRHSSISSLSHELTNESRSPSSFGDFEESDLEV